MKAFKFFWTAHRWTGVVAAIFILHVAVTGVLLIVKKRFPSLQPPTCSGAPGGVADFITLQRLFEAAARSGHAAFATPEDIDRIDFQPGKRVFKVLSAHGYEELQVDAVSGAILSHDWRPSDLIEDLHDGSWFGDWVHAGPWILVPIALIFLSVSGIYLWIEPLLRKRRRRTRA